MKKRYIFAAVMAGMMALTGCGTSVISKKEQTEEKQETEAGSWEVNQGKLSLDENDDAKKAFEKATEGLDGYSYEAIALLGTQVVAGTNYSILVRGTAVTPDAKPVYQIITIYADLDGNAEITGSKDLPSEFTANDGEYDFDNNEDVKAVFDQTLESLTGVEYEPVAYISSQTNGDTTYYAVMRSTTVTPNGTSEFVCMAVKVNAKGETEMGDIEAISLDTETDGEQIAVPFHRVDTLTDAEKEAGFTILAPEQINGSSTVEYQIYDEGMLEILYMDNDVNIIARIRKITGETDHLAGDYNVYAVTKQETVNGNTVAVCGDSEKLYVAEWAQNGYSLALSVEHGIEESSFLEIVAAIE